MKKIRRFEKGGFATSEDSEANEDRLGDFISTLDRGPVAAPAMNKTDDERAFPPPSPSMGKKASIVTKEELAKSGLSLRDYMNKQQGLTRRGAPAADTSNAYGKEQQYKRAQEAEQTPEGKAKRAAMEKSQALERSYPLENMVGGAAGVGIKTIAKLAQNLANRGGGAKTVVKRLERVEPTLREKELEIIKEVPRLLEGPKKQLALPKPTPRLEYDKAGAKAAGRNNRAAEQRAEMLKENARRSGLREDASAETLKAVRDKLGGKDFKLMKKGGSVKGYASGGSVSSASKRADGCAIRGKTRA